MPICTFRFYRYRYKLPFFFLGNFFNGKYNERVRIIKIIDLNNNEFEIITNNFQLSAIEIPKIYRQRWEIELFFKWLKQNLKFNSFIGYSENAIKIQIWIAMITYILLWKIYQEEKIHHKKIIKFYEFLAIIRTTLFLKSNNIRFSNWKNKEKIPLQYSLFGGKI